jgi:hypothetical protein
LSNLVNPPPNGNGYNKVVERIAEDAWFKIVTRGAIIILGVLVPLLSAHIYSVFSSIAEQSNANTKLLAVLVIKIENINTSFDIRLNFIGDRNNQQDQRLFRLEERFIKP